MNQTGISQFNQARIEWAIRLRYSPMPDLDMDRLASQINAFRIGELRTVGKTWELMLERDGELAINSDKRKADSAGLDWQITSDGSPAGDKHAAALQYFYNNLSATKALDQDATGGVDELIYQTLSAVDYYYSAHEILLRVDNPAAQEVTAEFRHTPVWFFEARRGYLGYLKHIFDLYGQPCIAGEWLTAVNLGWMRPLSLAYGAKWMSFREWLLFSQRYGSGFLEGITDAQRDSTEWNQAAQALNQLSSDGNVLHNKGTEFKFLDQPSKNQLPFQPIVELVDRLYAKCYRGVDLATGSRGSGVPHSGSGQGPTANPVGASVQREESGILLVRDAKWVSGVFNDRIDRPILRYLFNEEPRAWFTLMPPLNDTTAEDLQALRTLVPMGMRVALKEVYQRFRWSVSNAGEPCLSAPTAALSVASGQSSVEETPGQPGGNGQPTTDNEPRTTDQQLDVQTIPALTTEATPIAPGADPARNPGLLPRLNPSTVQPLNSASRQLPDPQVDASAFWSRTALAPRGADGQVLPMPSLGYALPNASTLERLNDLTKRGLGHTRAAQALQRKIQRQQALSNQRHESASSPLPNDFDPDQLRDEDGRWTTENNSSNAKTNTPPEPLMQLSSRAATGASETNYPNPAIERPFPEPTLRAMTFRERLGFDLRKLMEKLLPGTRTGELYPSRIPETIAAIKKLPSKAAEFSKAVVGDIAAGMRADPEFSGNIPAVFKGEELPMDIALRDAALEQNFRGEIPVATVMGRISEGVASSAPVIALTGGLPAAAQKAAAIAFTVKMIADAPEVARKLGEEFGKPPEQRDPDKIDSLVADAIQTVGFSVEGAIGIKRSFKTERPGSPKENAAEKDREPDQSDQDSELSESNDEAQIPDAKTLKKKYPRADLSNKILAEIWERSKAPDGKVYDPSGVEIKPGEPWQAGHRPEHKISEARRNAWKQNTDRETWNAYQRDPDIYRPEKPRTNLGYRFENNEY